MDNTQGVYLHSKFFDCPTNALACSTSFQPGIPYLEENAFALKNLLR